MIAGRLIGRCINGGKWAKETRTGEYRQIYLMVSVLPLYRERYQKQRNQNNACEEHNEDTRLHRNILSDCGIVQ